MGHVGISVIVPTHNRGRSLSATIDSLQRQSLSKQEYEIIVVDNASSDDTWAVVGQSNRLGEKQVRYLYEGRLGVHHARNAGARAAEESVLAFTDDDVICDVNWLRELLVGYAEPEAGCVGGRVLPKWELRPPRWISRYAQGYLSLLDRGDTLRPLTWPEDLYSCNLSIRRDLLVDLGGFNPELMGKQYAGDGEKGLLRKVYGAGWRVIYNPAALIWHSIPAGRLTLEYLRLRCRNQGVSNGYARYRESKPGRVGLIRLAASRLFRAFLHKYVASACAMAGRDEFYLHELHATSRYEEARYYLRLAQDRRLRSIAERRDWISDA